jgi:hypothetical protein
VATDVVAIWNSNYRTRQAQATASSHPVFVCVRRITLGVALVVSRRPHLRALPDFISDAIRQTKPSFLWQPMVRSAQLGSRTRAAIAEL